MKEDIDYTLVEFEPYGVEFQPLGRWEEKHIEFVFDKKISAIGIFGGKWDGDDVSFLTNIPQIRLLRIRTNRTINVSAVALASSLEELRLELGFGPKGKLDLSKLVNLKRLDLVFDRKITGWDSLVDLEHLCLQYVRGVRNISLTMFHRLAYLEVTNGRVLERIELATDMPLRWLELHYLPTLQTIRGKADGVRPLFVGSFGRDSPE